MRTYPLPLLLAVLASCSQPTEPPANVLQSFDLVTVDVDALPSMVVQEYDHDLWVNSERVEIRDDGRVKFYRTTVKVLVSTPPQPRSVIASMPPSAKEFRHAFVMEGDSIKIYLTNNCTTPGCDLEAKGTIIGGQMLLTRPAWSAWVVHTYALTPPPI